MSNAEQEPNDDQLKKLPARQRFTPTMHAENPDLPHPEETAVDQILEEAETGTDFWPETFEFNLVPRPEDEGEQAVYVYELRKNPKTVADFFKGKLSVHGEAGLDHATIMEKIFAEGEYDRFRDDFDIELEYALDNGYELDAEEVMKPLMDALDRIRKIMTPKDGSRSGGRSRTGKKSKSQRYIKRG